MKYSWLDGFITGAVTFGTAGFALGVIQRVHALTAILDWCTK